MSLLPERASFEERVQDCYVAFRGSGLMLSPLDAELASSWAEVGVPFEVVARGIRRAAELAAWDARPGEPLLRSLRACRRNVEAEIKKHHARSAGGADPDKRALGSLVDERDDRLRATLRKLSRTRVALGPSIEKLLTVAFLVPPRDLVESSRREDLTVAALARALPYSERMEIVREARRRTAESAALTEQGRRLARRFHTATLLRRALALPAFW